MTLDATLIDRLGAAALECRELLRDVHAATKDLRSAIREGEEAKARFEAEVTEWFRKAWESDQGKHLLMEIKKSYLHWVDVTNDVDQTMDALHRLERKINRRAIEMGVA